MNHEVFMQDVMVLLPHDIPTIRGRTASVGTNCSGHSSTLLCQELELRLA